MSVSQDGDITKMPHVRCFTCGKVLGHLEHQYREELAKGTEPPQIFQALGIKRYCCMQKLMNPICLPPGNINYVAQTQEDVDRMIKTYLDEPAKKSSVLNTFSSLQLGTKHVGRIGGGSGAALLAKPAPLIREETEAEKKRKTLFQFKLKRVYAREIPQTPSQVHQTLDPTQQ